MIMKDMTGYTLYVSKDGNSVEAVMNGDNDGHGRVRDDGYREVEEPEYWLVLLKQDREERDRKAIEEAMEDVRHGLEAGVF